MNHANLIGRVGAIVEDLHAKKPRPHGASEDSESCARPILPGEKSLRKCKALV